VFPSMLWIRIVFSTDPDSDPTFLVNVDQDSDWNPVRDQDPGFDYQKLSKKIENLRFLFFDKKMQYIYL
jgi:hypothetical protein